jgi:enoyl-CoA hydratase/carnithine racemase
MVLERERDGDVDIIRWNDGDNRVNLDSLAEWHEVLTELEHRDGPVAAVVCGTGKFFSNGLDLDRLGENTDQWPDTIAELYRLFGRLLVLPLYTVGALNGHTFAAGAMISLCLDDRVMRVDRGYWCLPEADLGLALSQEMFDVVSARLPGPTARKAILTAARYGGPEALDAGIVDAVASEDDLMEVAIARAAAMASTSRPTLRTHKEQLAGALARRLGWCTAGLS